MTWKSLRLGALRPEFGPRATWKMPWTLLTGILELPDGSSRAGMGSLERVVCPQDMQHVGVQKKSHRLSCSTHPAIQIATPGPPRALKLSLPTLQLCLTSQPLPRQR